MTDRGILRLLAHVSSHLAEDLGLDALARQVRRSPFALHRQFKSTAGETRPGSSARCAARRWTQGHVPIASGIVSNGRRRAGAGRRVTSKVTAPQRHDPRGITHAISI